MRLVGIPSSQVINLSIHGPIRPTSKREKREGPQDKNVSCQGLTPLVLNTTRKIIPPPNATKAAANR